MQMYTIVLESLQLILQQNLGGECVELLIRNLKECLKSGSKWEEARYLVRFIADLVNCHVISAGSLLQLLDNFVDAALEDGVPQVCVPSIY